MFCPNCGNQIADGSKFCAECGMPLAAVPEGTRSRSGAQPGTPRHSGTAAVPERRRVNATATAVPTGGNSCQRCGAQAVSCRKEKRIPVYKPSARTEAIALIIMGVVCLVISVVSLANGVSPSPSKGRHGAGSGLIVGPILIGWGVYRLWKIKNKAYDVTVCTCSSCGDSYIVEAPPKKTTW